MTNVVFFNEEFGQPNVPLNKATEIASIALPAGSWMITGKVNFYNATDNMAGNVIVWIGKKGANYDDSVNCFDSATVTVPRREDRDPTGDSFGSVSIAVMGTAVTQDTLIGGKRGIPRYKHEAVALNCYIVRPDGVPDSSLQILIGGGIQLIAIQADTMTGVSQ